MHSTRFSFVAYLALILCFANVVAAQTTAIEKSRQQKPARTFVYYPAPGDAWQRRQPAQVGMDSKLLEQAVGYAKTQESTIPPDFSTQVETFGKVLGKLPKERGTTNGIILRHGYIVAEWGDTARIDPTYSAAKSFLSTILGITIDRGLIKSVNDPVGKYVHDGGYDSAHNAKITWEEHAQQTSEWDGALWGKPADFVGHEEFGKGERKPRALQEPGAFWEYNDVRINRLALSLLRVWRKPLPEVLRNEIMNPIGASNSWQYQGYDNSYVMIDGRKMQSVSGGTRWGGGLWINTRDEARFGYLFLRKGRWQNKQLVSEQWVQTATMPGKLGPDYGYLWWLNTKGKQWPNAPATSFAAIGYGSNTIWIDPEHDIVVVWRWHQGNGDEFFKRILAAIKD